MLADVHPFGEHTHNDPVGDYRSGQGKDKQQYGYQLHCSIIHTRDKVQIKHQHWYAKKHSHKQQVQNGSYQDEKY